ncbi:MAG: alpha-glucosidase/alpha-galactosidase [Rhodobacteraceae bacterium]|nr:MAG: alpha-glucosidase/alpha-galactosidase [Paracoccaceae bacterium]
MNKIVFIGAGSTIFMKNIIGDILKFPTISNSSFVLMDIDDKRLSESEVVANELIAQSNSNATVQTSKDQKIALQDADFVIVTFQIGGYQPCTINDFEIPKKYNLQQTIGDTLGIGGIMRGLRTVPYLWTLCEDMLSVCPEAILLQYVNPMAINTWAIGAKYPTIKQIGLCHSVQGTLNELARDLGVDISNIHYQVAGINHLAFFLELKEIQSDGTYRDLYPTLKILDKKENASANTGANERCPNYVRYKFLEHFGYFVTESSEHFAEYVPWFIKSHRPDLINNFKIPLDEYPKRCQEQITEWKNLTEDIINKVPPKHTKSPEYAADIINSVSSGSPCTVYGNVINNGYINGLPHNAAVEVPCLIDGYGVHPQKTLNIPPPLLALIRTNINVQELTVLSLMNQDIESIYHAAMLDPHTGAELDLDQIKNLVDELIREHGEWMPPWLQ